MATEKILALGSDTGAIRTRLAQSYADYTSEDPSFAATRIDAAVRGLIAGALAALSPNERLIVGLLRETKPCSKGAQADMLEDMPPSLGLGLR